MRRGAQDSRGLGALDLSDLNASSAYADTADSRGPPPDGARPLTKPKARARSLRPRRESAGATSGRPALAEQPVLCREPARPIAVVRHDLPAADYATRAAKPAKTTCASIRPTQYLGIVGHRPRTGREHADTAGRGESAIEVLRSTTALADDPRLPSSLGPNLISTWFTLAIWEAETGQRAAAGRSFDAFVKARKEFDKLLPEGDSRRAVESRPGVVGSGALPAGRGQPNCRLRPRQCVNPPAGAIVLQFR